MARPGLTTHRKFRRLSRALGSPILARGSLELLWDACYEAGEDYVGTSDDIENLVGWSGEQGMLTRALVDAGAPEGHGFLEPVTTTGATGAVAYRVHDLWHHAPEYVAKRRARELARQEKSSPVVRRTAPNGGQCPETPDSQNRNGRTPSPSPSPSPSPVQQALRTPSAQDVVDLWNGSVTPPIPQVTKLTADRKAKIAARLKAYPDLEQWRLVFTWVNGQDWCRAPGTGNHPNWTASLDWLCRSDGDFQRQYERASQASPSRAPRFSSVPEWTCPHTPHCGSRWKCQQQQNLDRMRAES